MKVYLPIIILFFISSCALLKGNKEIESIKFKYQTDTPINYGETFTLTTLAYYKNGKTKDISSKNDLKITVMGGIYKNGRIQIECKPEILMPDTIYVQAEYVTETKTFSHKEAIPFNYLSPLTVIFRGENGVNGENGKNRSTPLLFKDGKTGEDGFIGQDGENGHDLTVNIWKEAETERYRVKVTDLTTNKTYQYTYKNNGFEIRFDVTGGNGGTGGEGGEGGDGKDGLISDKKTRLPGDGGTGGNGGNGGLGGTGGSVYVFLHPNAKELEQKITVYNFGGDGGQAGAGGPGGKGGKPAEGQDLTPDGTSGGNGWNGEKGQQGPILQLIIDHFDIE